MREQQSPDVHARLLLLVVDSSLKESQQKFAVLVPLLKGGEQ